MADHQICKASAPKYALGLKIREPLFWKHTFLYMAQSNSMAELVNSVAELDWFGGRKISKQDYDIGSKFGGRIFVFGGRIPVFKIPFFLPFCGLQLHESQCKTLKNTWKMPTKLVMTKCHHNPKLASLLVLKEQT